MYFVCNKCKTSLPMGKESRINSKPYCYQCAIQIFIKKRLFFSCCKYKKNVK